MLYFASLEIPESLLYSKMNLLTLIYVRHHNNRQQQNVDICTKAVLLCLFIVAIHVTYGSCLRLSQIAAGKCFHLSIDSNRAKEEVD